jgi:hypothetical protein
MTTKGEKVEHVKKARQIRTHGCHWPGCEEQVPPAKWGCRDHWFRLPKSLRDEIWDSYIPGQEQRLDPSPEYIATAEKVQAWIEEHWL